MRKRHFLINLAVLLMLSSLSCGKGQVYKKGELEIEIVKTEWNHIYAGPYRVAGGGLVIALNINYLGSGEIPEPKMSVRTASGTSVEQGTTAQRVKGRTASIDTFFLISKTDEPLYLIVGDFDPIPLYPVNKLK